MAIPSQPVDGNYKPVPGVYSPSSAQFAAVQGGPVQISSDTTPYAPQMATLTGNTGLPVNIPAIVQKARNASTGSVSSVAATFASANVGGNSIIVVCGAGNNGTLTVTDSAGNTYVQAVLKANSTTFEAAIFYAVGIVSSAANVVTVTNAGAAASMAVQVYEVSGLLAQVVAQPDQNTSGTGTSATPTLSALAASTPTALAFLGIAVGTAAQAVSATSGTNWTLDSTQNTTTPAGLYTFGALSEFLGNTTPVIPTATVASSEPYAAVSAIFKPVIVGIQGTVTVAGYNYTHISSDTTTLIKTGPGILHSIIINTHGASATIEFDDALTHTSPVIGIITLPSTITSAIPISLEYDVQFSTGLSITTGVAAVDITVVWK